ncbi:hypothetical protein OPT61_g4661 [Boeremia exigua]|uniref:Uncharacterized protein n=1 Tax=Boeremia exigua TaxID=749465 RepID=A0ACC2IDE9_9PLEO|nr:hypothetical protein OPT61_g4661 [Boeremia exigua]
MGNGAKAQQKRDRKGDAGPKEAKSQLKSVRLSYPAAQPDKTTVTFQSTTNRKLLTEHATNKHSKQFTDCFNAEDGVAK